MKVQASEGLTVWGRPAELRRVFLNLLDNAAKFSADGATIEIRLCSEDAGSGVRGASLEVIDCGPGVPAQQRARLFQRFSSGKAGGGTGLGLYLANQIVMGHGGAIHYAPGEGRGSCFRVWLPLAGEAVAA